MLNIKKDLNGRAIVPKTTLESDTAGEVEVLTTDGAEYYHNGSSRAKVVTDSHSATFTNKTIDANGTGNSITNLETADLAADVLNIDLEAGAGTDSQVPSALAVQTYVQSETGSVQEDVDDLITLSGVPANSTDLGTFIGTTIPDGSDNKEAFQALETAVETNDTNLANHISDATDAHAASAITNTPAGTIAATTVQAAIDELDGDIQTKVTGPASATDEAVVRYDLTTGKLVQNSVVTITDAGIIAGATGITSSGTINSTGTLTANGDIVEGQVTDSSTTGANATITNPAFPFVRLTNASLTSIDMISSPVNGEVLTIENATGNSITINNNTGGTAANRILTGTKAPLTVADEASIILKYDATETRWMIIGGSGAGGSLDLDLICQLDGSDVPLWSTGNNASFLGGGALSGTFAADTSTPLHGISSYKYTQASGSLNDYFVTAAQAVDPRFRGVPVTLYFPYTYNGANNDIEVIIYDATNAAIIPNSAFIQLTTGNTVFKTNVTVPLTCTSIRVGFMTRVANSGKILAFDDVRLSADNTVYALQPYITSWQSYTPTITGFGTPTALEFQYRQVGQNYEIRGKFTSGTSTAVEARVSLPQGATSANTSVIPSIQVAGVITRTTNDNAIYALIEPSVAYFTMSSSGSASSGMTKANGSGVEIAGNPISIKASIPINGLQASSSQIVQSPDTFSTDTATLTYAGSSTYTLTTLANAPVGTFITFTYAINTDTRTQTNAAAPTQTTSDMNANGILLTARNRTSASTSALPAAVSIQIGKGLKGVTNTLYKSTGKSTTGEMDLTVSGTTEFGFIRKSYNESTGILTLDCGESVSTANTVKTFLFTDQSAQASGYVTISGSKNPALTGLNISAVAARGINTSGQSISTGTTITYDASKTFDTNGDLNATTGIFTASVAGYYQVNAAIYFQSAAYTAGQQIKIEGFKNSSAYSTGLTFTMAAATSVSIGTNYSDIVFLSVGQTFELRATNDRGATSLNTTAGRNYLSITKTNVG